MIKPTASYKVSVKIVERFLQTLIQRQNLFEMFENRELYKKPRTMEEYSSKTRNDRALFSSFTCERCVISMILFNKKV